MRKTLLANAIALFTLSAVRWEEPLYQAVPYKESSDRNTGAARIKREARKLRNKRNAK